MTVMPTPDGTNARMAQRRRLGAVGAGLGLNLGGQRVTVLAASGPATPSRAAATTAGSSPMPEPLVDGSLAMSEEEKIHLVRHGFVIIRDAVPKAVIDRCRERIYRDDPRVRKTSGFDLLPKSGSALPTCDEVMAVWNESTVKQKIRSAMGPFSPLVAAQVAITPPNTDTGFGGHRPTCHCDGTWGGPAEPFPRGMELAPMEGMREECLRPIDPTLRVKLFGEDETETVSPLQTGVLWQDKAKTVSMGSYTCVVGIALNDQRRAGKGQFGVYAGMHQPMQQFFRWQRDMGGPIGPDGPGWPRLVQDAKGFVSQSNGIPPALRKQAQAIDDRETPFSDAEGWPWPEISPCLLSPGDAVVALHSCPHSPTPNASDDPRMNLYFRIRRFRERDPNEGTRRMGHGVNDHLDRGAYGQWLDYPEGYDPIRVSVDAMCDHWSEWDGIDDALLEQQQQAL